MPTRKILKVGNSSLAVSLPKEFSDSNNLTNGQEVNVEYHGTSLIIRCDRPQGIEKEIDLTKLATKKDISKLLDKIVGALFRQGNDTVIIHFSNEKHASIVREILRKGKLNLYEEPWESNDKSTKIHSAITQYDEESLHNMTNVIIKDIYKTLDEYLKLMKANKLTKEASNRLIERDRIINDHTDICKRIINKNVRDYISTSIFSFVDKLEKIGDEVKYIVEFSIKNPSEAKKHLKYLEEIKDLFFMLYNANTNFTIQKISAFNDQFHQLYDKLDSIKTPEIYYHYKNTIKMIRDSYSDLMVKNL